MLQLRQKNPKEGLTSKAPCYPPSLQKQQNLKKKAKKPSKISRQKMTKIRHLALKTQLDLLENTQCRFRSHSPFNQPIKVVLFSN